MLAGVMIVLARVMQVWLFGDSTLSVHGGMPLFVPLVGIPGLIGSILFLLAVTGLYLYQSESAGTLGLLTFLFAFVGISLSVGANWTYAFGSPYLVSTAPTVLDANFNDPAWGVFGQGFIYSYMLSGVGYLAFTISTIIVGKLPRWIGIIMFSSMLGAALLPISTNGVGAIVVNIFLGMGPFIFGLYLWRESEVEAKVFDRGAA
jgi:hypothetical protein